MTNLHEKLCPEFKDPELEYFILFSTGRRVNVTGKTLEFAKNRVKISYDTGMTFQDSMLSAYLIGIHDATNHSEDEIMIGMQVEQKQTM